MVDKKYMHASAKMLEKMVLLIDTSATVVACLVEENHTGPWHSQIY
jgi:hypothetical protein